MRKPLRIDASNFDFDGGQWGIQVSDWRVDEVSRKIKGFKDAYLRKIKAIKKEMKRHAENAPKNPVDLQTMRGSSLEEQVKWYLPENIDKQNKLREAYFAKNRYISPTDYYGIANRSFKETIESLGYDSVEIIGHRAGAQFEKLRHNVGGNQWIFFNRNQFVVVQ